MSRYLIIKSRHIGDVLLAGPLVSAIRQSDADAHITMATKKGTEMAVINHPHLDEVITFPEKIRGESKVRAFRRLLAFYFGLRGRFDVCINTTEGDRGAFTALFSGAKEKIGYRSKPGKAWRNWIYTDLRERFRGMIHAVMTNQEMLPTGVAEYRRVHLGLPDENVQKVDALLNEAGWDGKTPLVQIHPTARWFFKCWTDDGVAAAIDHFHERGCKVVMTSGPDAHERQKLDNILSLAKSQPIDLGGKISLIDLAALATRCSLYFGVDTAPMHFAAAADVPVVAVYGPTGVYDWGPWPNDWPGERTPYEQIKGIQYAREHTVIQQERECVPCGRDGCDGSKRSDCLETLAVNVVLAEIDKSLERNGIV